MSTIFLLSLLVLTGVAAWFAAELNERKKYTGRIFDLQFQLRSAQSSASNFRQQCEKLNHEIQSLRQSFERELSGKQTTLLGFQQTFKKTVTISLVAGLMLGGMVSGIWAYSAATGKQQSRLMELDIIARVARMHAEHFQNELEKLKIDYDRIRHFLDEERVAKTVALTKLEIILDNLTADKWGRSFSLESLKLKQDWQKSNPLETVSEKTSLTPPPVRF